MTDGADTTRAEDDRPQTARLLALEPHPEGGWFRRMWTGSYAVDTPAGPRPAATCIHYLLRPDERSAWHVVTSDEVWLWHGPGALELSLGGAGAEPGAAETVTLGPTSRRDTCCSTPCPRACGRRPGPPATPRSS